MALALSGLLATDHVVRRGETLAGIASRYGVSVSAIAKANGITDPNHIEIGDHLSIPSGGGTTSSGGGYRVGSGDTLSDIADRFGSSISALVRANGLSDADRIYIGQRLRIPGRASGSSSSGGGSASGYSGRVDPGAAYHIVRPGESLASIAARYGVPASRIASANGIVDGRLFAHARVFLQHRNKPATAGGSGGGASSHTVRAGENLAGIAARYGSSVRAIAQANGIGDPNLIRIGQRLRVPTGRASGIVCPVAGARFMNDWGFPRSGGRYHEGNDLFAPRGTPVRAPVGGRVEHVVGRVGGNQIRLWGRDGSVYIGSHLQGFARGGWVDAGTVIGYVGSSGNAVGGPTHLHFEIRPGNGPAVNPYPSLRTAC